MFRSLVVALLVVLGPLVGRAAASADDLDEAIDAPQVDPLPGHLNAWLSLQLAQPFLGKAPTYNAMAQLDAGFELPSFEVLLVPRLRIDDITAPVKSGALFLQQGYATLRFEQLRLKIGRVLGQFGRIWDYGLYGPLLAGTDVKLTPDIGLSLEGTHCLANERQLFWAAQFFLVDGKAFSFRNPEFFTLEYARRRNISSARLQPSLPLGDGRLSVAVNGQHFQSVRRQMAHVWRAAADIDYTKAGFDAFAEVGQQWGHDLPSDDKQLIGRHTYVWAGIQKAVGPVLLRHHLNMVFYRHDQHWLDVLHQPGAEWSVSPHFSLIAEAALWHNVPDQQGRGEYSLFLVAMGKT